MIAFSSPAGLPVTSATACRWVRGSSNSTCDRSTTSKSKHSCATGLPQPTENCSALVHGPMRVPEQTATELLAILARPSYQAGHIRELCTNPLLLTILCIVFHEERKLPTGRAELYAHCVRVLLEYWRRDLYESDLGTALQAYDAEAAQSVLARLAWWLHQEQDRTSAPLDELADEVAKGLAQVSPSTGLGRDGIAFLERMRDEAGILAMEGEGRCGFLHLSFQEYLAAEHAAREGLPGSWPA